MMVEDLIELEISSVLAIHPTPIAEIESETDGEPVEGPAIGITTVDAGALGRRVAVILYTGGERSFTALLEPELAQEVAGKIAHFSALAWSEGRA